MYRITTDCEVEAQIDAMPAELLPYLAQLLDVLELVPWNSDPYNEALPDGIMRTLLFGPSGRTADAIFSSWKTSGASTFSDSPGSGERICVSPTQTTNFPHLGASPRRTRRPAALNATVHSHRGPPSDASSRAALPQRRPTAQGIGLPTEYKGVSAALVESDTRPETVNQRIREAVTGPRVTKVASPQTSVR